MGIQPPILDAGQRSRIPRLIMPFDGSCRWTRAAANPCSGQRSASPAVPGAALGLGAVQAGPGASHAIIEGPHRTVRPSDRRRRGHKRSQPAVLPSARGLPTLNEPGTLRADDDHQPATWHEKRAGVRPDGRVRHAPGSVAAAAAYARRLAGQANRGARRAGKRRWLGRRLPSSMQQRPLDAARSCSIRAPGPPRTMQARWQNPKHQNGLLCQSAATPVMQRDRVADCGGRTPCTNWLAARHGGPTAAATETPRAEPAPGRWTRG